MAFPLKSRARVTSHFPRHPNDLSCAVLVHQIEERKAEAAFNAAKERAVNGDLCRVHSEDEDEDTAEDGGNGDDEDEDEGASEDEDEDPGEDENADEDEGASEDEDEGASGDEGASDDDLDLVSLLKKVQASSGSRPEGPEGTAEDSGPGDAQLPLPVGAGTEAVTRLASEMGEAHTEPVDRGPDLPRWEMKRMRMPRPAGGDGAGRDGGGQSVGELAQLTARRRRMQLFRAHAPDAGAPGAGK